MRTNSLAAATRIWQTFAGRNRHPRIKRINGGRLTAGTFGAQQNEIAICIKIANRNMQVARPITERVR